MVSLLTESISYQFILFIIFLYNLGAFLAVFVYLCGRRVLWNSSYESRLSECNTFDISSFASYCAIETL